MRNILLSLVVFLSACANLMEVDLSDGKENAAVLQMPAALELLAIDDKAHEAPMFGGSTVRYRMEPGEHELVLHYRQVFELSDGHEIVVSEPVVLKFNLAPGQRYVLDFQPPQEIEAARNLVANLELSVVQAGGEQVVARSQKAGFKLAAHSNPGDWFKDNEIENGEEALSRIKELWPMLDAGQQRQFYDWADR